MADAPIAGFRPDPDAEKGGLKVGIESMTGCLNTCAGCMLTREERRDHEHWAPALREAAGGLFARLAARATAGLERREIRHLYMLCGQGDHFLMRDEAIDGFMAWMARSGGGLASGEITTSLIGAAAQVQAAAEAFHAASLRHRQPLLVSVVFNPEKARHLHFGSTYGDSIAMVRRLFGTVDMAVNLGADVIDGTTPEAMHGFVRDCRFLHMEFNLVPTGATMAAFVPIWPRLVAWLRRYHALWLEEPGYDLGFGYVLSIHAADTEGLSGAPLIDRLAQHFAKELYIDHEGRVFHAQSGGLGALVPFTTRHGFAPIGRVDDEPEDLAGRIDESARRMATQVLSSTLRDRRCATCPRQGACASAGFHLLRKALAGAGVETEDCPIGIRGLLDDVADANQRRGKTLSRIPFEAVQKGLADSPFDPARGRVIEDADLPVRMG